MKDFSHYRNICLYSLQSNRKACSLCTKNAHSPGDPAPPHLTHSFLVVGLTWVHAPNGISIGSAVLALLMVVTNRQTYTPRCFCSNATHLMLCIATRPNNAVPCRYADSCCCFLKRPCVVRHVTARYKLSDYYYYYSNRHLCSNGRFWGKSGLAGSPQFLSHLCRKKTFRDRTHNPSVLIAFLCYHAIQTRANCTAFRALQPITTMWSDLHFAKMEKSINIC